MSQTKVVIKAVGDTEPFEVEAPEWGELETVVIVEKATAEGKTGLTLVIKLPNGRNVCAGVTAAIFNGIHGAFSRAEARFRDEGEQEVPQTLPEVINALISQNKLDTNLISDGYHTFGQLYDHRITLFIALCRLLEETKKWHVWRTKKHSDGELAFGGEWFVLGIGVMSGEQITYHLPIEDWHRCSFADTRLMAPEWDGHTSEDVLERINKL